MNFLCVIFFFLKILYLTNFEFNFFYNICALLAFGNFIFSGVGIFLVERSGRRYLTLSSILGVTVTLLFLGFAFSFNFAYPYKIAFLGLYVAFFAYGMGPMPWTINSEIFPLEIRGKCNAFTTGVYVLYEFLI